LYSGKPSGISVKMLSPNGSVMKVRVSPANDRPRG
jgi:hypothetical protein